MDGHLKFADFFTIALIVAAVVIAVHWWFKKKCSCTVPRMAADGPRGTAAPAKRAGVMSCS